MKKPTKIVLAVMGDTIKISCSDKSKFKLLKEMGAHRKLFARDKWVIKYSNQAELLERFKFLRDQKFMFSGGIAGWPPASIFFDFRNKGLIDGNILEIVWKNKDNPIIREI